MSTCYNEPRAADDELRSSEFWLPPTSFVVAVLVTLTATNSADAQNKPVDSSQAIEEAQNPAENLKESAEQLNAEYDVQKGERSIQGTSCKGTTCGKARRNRRILKTKKIPQIKRRLDGCRAKTQCESLRKSLRLHQSAVSKYDQCLRSCSNAGDGNSRDSSSVSGTDNGRTMRELDRQLQEMRNRLKRQQNQRLDEADDAIEKVERTNRGVETLDFGTTDESSEGSKPEVKSRDVSEGLDLDERTPSNDSSLQNREPETSSSADGIDGDQFPDVIDFSPEAPQTGSGSQSDTASRDAPSRQPQRSTAQPWQLSSEVRSAERTASEPPTYNDIVGRPVSEPDPDAGPGDYGDGEKVIGKREKKAAKRIGRRACRGRRCEKSVEKTIEIVNASHECLEESLDAFFDDSKRPCDMKKTFRDHLTIPVKSKIDAAVENAKNTYETVKEKASTAVDWLW